MKNKTLLFIFSLLFSGAVMAQTTGRIGQHESITRWTVPTNNFASTAEGQQIAQQIIDVLGLKPNFTVQAANIQNAAAVVYGGKRYILYNPGFISQLTRATGTKWAAVSVLAHEIGHHLNGHTVTATGSQPALELEADEFSGFVLRKMGASLADAQAAMKVIAQQRASTTHPGQYDRLASIEKGWAHADEQLNGRNTVAQSRPQTPQRQEPVVSGRRNPEPVQQSAISDRTIIGDVRFNADPRSAYYITSQYNLVKLDRKNQLYVIGKLTTLHSRQYPYMISDDANTQLLVDARGNILTRKGQPVGTLSARRG